jgi:F0F1-type ATP synthase delta subunit
VEGQEHQCRYFLTTASLPCTLIDSVTKIMKAWKVTDTTLNFFITLARNNRLDHSSGMIGAFNTLMSSSRNEVVCTITSAVELTSAIQGNLKKSLAAFAPGQAINFQTVVSRVPELILVSCAYALCETIASLVSLFISQLRVKASTARSLTHCSHDCAQVDPDIIGGVIVEIGGDKYIDMSTRTKVNKLVKELSAPI